MSAPCEEAPSPDLTPQCVRLFNTPQHDIFQVSLYDTYGITAAKLDHSTICIRAQARTLLIEVIVRLDTPTTGLATLAVLSPERATDPFGFASLHQLLLAVAGVYRRLRHLYHPELSPPPPAIPPQYPGPPRCGG